MKNTREHRGQAKKRFISLCIPGDEERGIEPAWFVFDRMTHRNVCEAENRQAAVLLAKKYNAQNP
jgi:hypothetical protein